MAENQPLRVAMIIQSYLPRLGGAEKQLAAVCRKLRMKGIEPAIITRRYRGMQAFELIEQTPVYRVPAPQPKALAAFCFIIFGLLKIQKIKPHILHAHELLSPTDMAILAKKLWGIPVIVKVLRGGRLGDFYKLNHRKFGKIRIQRLKKNIDIFLAISTEIQMELQDEGIYGNKCRFLPNGVDIDKYRPLTEKGKNLLRRELGLPAGFICIFSGRLSPEKGLSTLLSAWQKITEIHSQAHLLILGSGELETDLRKKIPSHVIFKGYVPETKLYYQASDAFILPSETEGLSNSMLEAMACALPVVVSNVGAAPDIISHKENGLLVKPGHKAEIVDVIDFLISNPQKRIQIGKKGLGKIRKEYSLDTTVDRLASLYFEISAKEEH